MSDPVWKFASFDEAKSHAYPHALEAELLADLAARSCTLQVRPHDGVKQVANPRVIMEYGYDAGGFWIQGEPSETISFFGLSLSLPCLQIDGAFGQLTRLTERRFASGTRYYKWHGKYSALVLPPELWAELVLAIRCVLPSATARGDAFYEEFLRKLRERNARESAS